MSNFVFWLKYKLNTNMSTEQYNEGLIYIQKLDLDTLFKFLNQENVEFHGNEEKLDSLFKQVQEYDIITHIASCAIRPRFGNWKKKNRHKYCRDVGKSMSLAFELTGFFLLKCGFKLPNLGNSLKTIGQILESMTKEKKL